MKASRSDAETRVAGRASTSSSRTPTEVRTVTRFPTVTALEGFALRPSIVTCPARQDVLERLRVLNTRTHHNQESTRELNRGDATIGIVSQVEAIASRA